LQQASGAPGVSVRFDLMNRSSYSIGGGTNEVQRSNLADPALAFHASPEPIGRPDGVTSHAAAWTDVWSKGDGHARRRWRRRLADRPSPGHARRHYDQLRRLSGSRLT
jgi:hypothetical protein